MIKLMLRFIIFFAISSIVSGQYAIETEDIHALYSQEDIYEETYVIEVPFIITTFGKATEDLFLTASYGGINQKDQRQFFGNTKASISLDDDLKEQIDIRTLRSRKHQMNYKLKTQFATENEIKAIHDVIERKDVLSIKKEQQRAILGQINQTLYIELDNTRLYPNGNYRDIITLFLFKGSYDDAQPLILATAQIEFNIHVPNITKIVNMDLESVGANSAKLYLLSFTQYSNQQAVMKITQKLGNQTIGYISDGKQNLEFKDGFFHHRIQANDKALIKEFYVFLNQDFDSQNTNEIPELNYKIIDLN